MHPEASGGDDDGSDDGGEGGEEGAGGDDASVSVVGGAATADSDGELLVPGVECIGGPTQTYGEGEGTPEVLEPLPPCPF
jgi:hypothetical protein